MAFTKITTGWLFLRVRPQDISEAECPESARNRQVSEVNTWLCWPSSGRTFASLGRYFCPPFVRPLQRSCSAAPLLPRPSAMGRLGFIAQLGLHGADRDEWPGLVVTQRAACSSLGGAPGVQENSLVQWQPARRMFLRTRCISGVDCRGQRSVGAFMPGSPGFSR